MTVLYGGAVLEQGNTAEILRAPQHAIRAHFWRRARVMTAGPEPRAGARLADRRIEARDRLMLIEARNVALDVPDMNAAVLIGRRPKLRILKPVSLAIAKGETVGDRG